MSASRRKAGERGARAQVAPDAFNKVVAHATIQGIRLIGTKFAVKPRALSSDRSKWQYQLRDELTDSHCDDDELVLHGNYEYEASCLAGRSTLLTVTAEYLATFRLSSQCDAEAGSNYLETVGKFACYPYFRALFATLTDQCGLVLPPLPIISAQPRLVKPRADQAGSVAGLIGSDT